MARDLLFFSLSIFSLGISSKTNNNEEKIERERESGKNCVLSTQPANVNNTDAKPTNEHMYIVHANNKKTEEKVIFAKTKWKFSREKKMWRETSHHLNGQKGDWEREWKEKECDLEHWETRYNHFSHHLVFLLFRPTILSSLGHTEFIRQRMTASTHNNRLHTNTHIHTQIESTNAFNTLCILCTKAMEMAASNRAVVSKWKRESERKGMELKRTKWYSCNFLGHINADTIIFVIMSPTIHFLSIPRFHSVSLRFSSIFSRSHIHFCGIQFFDVCSNEQKAK